MTDLDIAHATKLESIVDIAKKLGIEEDNLELYGNYKAKLSLELMKKPRKGKLVLVTAMSPTPLGEGKTTMSIGLADALSSLGLSTCLALREPSLGPVFGIKGGATGGGRVQVAPMEDINLHFTGDIHAITTANNLIAAVLDNHIFQGNELNIDTHKITWRRCMDMNDRQLRYIKDGLGGEKNGVARDDGFDISVASEMMAVLCLSTSIADLKSRIGDMIVAYNIADKPVRVRDLGIEGAVATVLKDAIKPNLVQTLEGTPAIIHGGPFANIAHGCNSIIATRTALSLADVVVTEAGFGADLGGEKFLDIKCREMNTHPDCVVIVATVRALKYHGGMKKEELISENIEALSEGMKNLYRHIDNIKTVYGLNVVVCINRFATDTDREIELLTQKCKALNVKVVCSTAFAQGGKGSIDLANVVLEEMNKPSEFRYCYDVKDSIKDKVNAVATRVYHAGKVEWTKEAQESLERLERLGLTEYPVCIAKTQYSFSDDKDKLNAPDDFTFHIRELKLMAGARFIVAIAGSIMTMPGLPKSPAALRIDIDDKGVIKGIF